MLVLEFSSLELLQEFLLTITAAEVVSIYATGARHIVVTNPAAL